MFKYALKNVMRVPLGSIAIFLVLTILFTGFMVTYSISLSAKRNMEDMRREMGGRVNLEVDIESYIDELVKFQEGKTTTQPVMKKLEWTQVDRISKSEYVEDYNVTLEGAGKSPIKHVTYESTEESGDLNPDFRLIGDRLLEYNSEFYYKEKILVEGKGYTKEDVENNAQVAVIDRKLADLNQLASLRSIKFTSIEGVDMDLKIIGIYEDTMEDTGNIPMSYMIRANCIYAPYTTAMESRGNASYKDLITETAFFVKDPLEITNFRNRLYRTTIQLGGYLLNADDAIYEKKSLPLSFTKSLIEQPGRVVLVGGLIVSLLYILVISFGKKKTGTALRVMGLNNKKTFRFLVSGFTLIVLFSFVLSIVLSLLFTQPLADRTILSTQKAVEQVIAVSEQDAI
ncbi:MAG TPA: hypothetical protein DDZ89_14165, partial [Clostridiales bacterium]|nr:hypothetical protein [Clostridiales bacterium]